MIRHIAIFLVSIYVHLFYRHRVYGKKNIPKEGGIIAANHASFIDPPLIGISCPYEVHFLARASLFHFPPFAWLIRKLNTHPVTKGRENVGAIKNACDLLEKNKKVVIFPEGERTEDGNFRKVQGGVGMLVMRTQASVIPVYVHGTYQIWPKKRKFPKVVGKTACVFGKPLSFRGSYENKKEGQQQIADEIMAAISALRHWYLSGAKGVPP